MIKILLKRKVALIAAIYLCIIVLLGVTASVVAPFPRNEQHVSDRLTAPNQTYLLGTDNLGQDILSQIIYGCQMTLIGSLGIVTFSVVFGTILGVFAGYFPKFRALVMRLIDALMAFPPLLLAMVLVTTLGQGMVNVIVAIGAYFMTRMTRIVYGLTLQIREETYIEAERSLGASQFRIVFKHIIPNLLSPIIVQATFTFSSSLLQMASLDYLGLGIPPKYPTWGNMLSVGKDYMTVAPWMVMIPGIIIVLTVLSLNIVGDLLRDNADPKFRDLMKGA